MDLSPDSIKAIDGLISKFNALPVLTKADLERKEQNYRDDTWRRLLNGEEYHEAIETPSMYRQSRELFQTTIQDTNNNLEWQCATVSVAFDRYERIAETPAPYFAWRIAVILRKAKDSERELAFLKAWCRHFKNAKNGRRFDDLVDRLVKLERKNP